MECECGGKLNIVEEDSRQMWYEAHLECKECGTQYTHRTEFNQNGLVVSDELTKENKPICSYCGISLEGYSWVDVATHFKEKHNISILDREEKQNGSIRH